MLDQFRVPYKRGGDHKHVRRGWIGFDCPFCGPGSGKYHAAYNEAGGFINCWQCGGLGIHRVLAALLDVGPGQVAQLLRDLDSPSPKHEPKPVTRLQLPLGVVESTLFNAQCRYLEGRGFDPKRIGAQWDLGSINMSPQPEFNWRIYIPIKLRNKTVSWTTRSLSDSNPVRYRAAAVDQETISRRELLYGIDYVRNTMIVCEGPADVWAIGPGAVATLGLAYSTAQVIAISQAPVRVICFDNEPAAQARARKLCSKLAGMPGSTHNVTLDAKDAGSASRREIRQLRHSFLE